jgi:hypothetical protein
MKSLNLRKFYSVKFRFRSAAILLATLAIIIATRVSWGGLGFKVGLLEKAQASMMAQTNAKLPWNGMFYARSYGGKCLTVGPPIVAALGGWRVFISDCNGSAAQQIRVEELTDRPGHLVVLHVGPGVIGKKIPMVVTTGDVLNMQNSANPEELISTGQADALPVGRDPLPGGPTDPNPNPKPTPTATPSPTPTPTPAPAAPPFSLEVQTYTGSAGQIFALDGDSIILTEDRTLVVEVENNRGANGTPLVLGHRDLADSEFWTFSALDGSNRKPTSGFVEVTQKEVTTAQGPYRDTRNLMVQFIAALQGAQPGTVIEIDPDAVLDLSGYPVLYIPEGVTIRGSRRGELFGPEISTDSAPGGMFDIRDNDVRITGLRLRGPSRDTDGDQPDAVGVFAYDNNLRTIVDHNDLSDWTEAAVRVDGYPNGGNSSADCGVSGPDPRLRVANVRVVRNFIHDNQKEEAGYGVCVNVGGFALIEGNTFDANRHAIKGGGEATTGYLAYHNLILTEAPLQHYLWHTQDFDVHGVGDNGFGGRGGQYFDIGWNTFLGTDRENFDLRGEPCLLAEFHHNVSLQGYNEQKKEGDAVSCSECGAGIYKLMAHENQFSSPNPTAVLGVGDFDGDGKDDLFLATGAAWYYAPAGRAEWRYLNARTEKLANLLLGDFDGDGRTDVFTTQGRNWMVSWGGASPWEKVNASGASLTNFAVGDFDGDRRADIFYADGQAWYVSSGATAPFKLFDTSSFGVADLRFGDFNGDGKTDVFSVANGAWSVTYGGTVNWSILRSRLTDNVKNLVVADFNGDGKADVAQAACPLVCNWQVSYSGTGGWTPLNNLSPFAAVGHFDNNKGADVLLWTSQNYLNISSAGTGVIQRYSNQDQR